MKYSRLLFVLSMAMFCVNLSAQEIDKEAEKLQRLKDKVERGELKVADKKRKLEIADSLLIVGEEKIAEAEEEFIQVEKEMALLDKEYKLNIKPLWKLERSKDPTISKKASTDIKALDAQYKIDSKDLQTKVKTLTKQATSGQSNLEKGKEKKKTYTPALKEAQEYLDNAREAYNAALYPPE